MHVLYTYDFKRVTRRRVVELIITIQIRKTTRKQFNAQRPTRKKRQKCICAIVKHAFLIDFDVTVISSDV